ncbi:TPA: hypothetical protein ACVB9Y_004452 [Escherichia coli]|nr:hypothetical protein [Escherichia coli]EFB5296001.1 hypothetical protein [Escherichia coli]EFB6924121.1 hypothetical protein [Escherichia coli]EFF0473973.1 hypothetical protein [Escherichia coli]EFG2242346.1 hypothetical protein [Escherichia coli]
MENIVSAIDNKDEKSFSNYLNEQPDINALSASLSAIYAKDELLFIYDKKSRIARDKFIHNTIKLIINKDGDCLKFIKSRMDIIRVAELILDKISQQLASCELSKQSPEIQAWSLIINTENVVQEILNDSIMENEIIDDSSFNVKIKNKDGNSYNSDDLLHSHINALTLSLKYLSHKFKWEHRGKYIFPEKVLVSQEHINSSERVKVLGSTWQNLTKVVDNCFYFNGFVATHNEEQMDEIKRRYSIKEDVLYLFYYPLHPFLAYEQIACERFRQRHHQELLETVHYLKRKNINIKQQGDIDRILTYNFFEHYFCCDIRKDKVKYNNLRLIEWVDSFLALKKLANDVLEGKRSAILKNIQLIKYLQMHAISAKSATLFLDMITFGKNSSDLFDTPLLQLEGNKIYLLTSALNQINTFRVIMSRLPSVEKNISAKGYNFEKQVVELLKHKNISIKKFKREISGEKYEYDCVFLLDDKIFLFECKNKNIAWGSPKNTFRNALFYQKCIDQAKRLEDGLRKHPDILKSEFEINVDEHEIVTVIYNCLPFSIRGKVDGVYIADHSSFSRLMKSTYINKTKSYGAIEKSSYKQWSGDSLSAEDIINHFENPFQLNFYNGALKQYNTSHSVDDITFSLVDYITDNNIIRSNKKDFFDK